MTKLKQLVTRATKEKLNFQLGVEQDKPEVQERRLWAPKPKAKAKQVVQQSYDANELRPQHVTRKTVRTEQENENSAKR